MINTKIILEFANNALDDYEKFTSGKGYEPPPQGREAFLAKWITETLSAPIDDDVRDSCKIGLPGNIECMGYTISVADARSLAAALLMMVDEVES